MESAKGLCVHLQMRVSEPESGVTSVQCPCLGEALCMLQCNAPLYVCSCAAVCICVRH